MPSVFPEGTAKKNSRRRRPVVPGSLHAHRPGAGPTAPRSVFIFVKTKPTREAYTVGIANPDLLLPARADKSPVASSMDRAAGCRLVSFMPHMHLRGKDFKSPSPSRANRREVFLSVPGLRFRLADLLCARGADDLPQGDADRLPGPLRQLGEQPLQPRPQARWSAGASRRSRR